ncbi:hypothetical protein MBRA1_000556 [Malassezia brasiliensis]|uniref:EKC/KEOPS complex subunit CGI121 n=1 Tax=Malassezia brasiliensis TaxID=1821822 RepID=A0AAF0INN0_9BASI|nr:hypothetical protein MBRA1_000556 [Malassezia brasiliensis]
METVRLPAAWAHGAYERVYVAQFAHVRNGAALKNALIAASKAPENSDERRRMDYAFVDARLLVSRAQLLTAVVEAIAASERVRKGEKVGLKTPSIHSEVLWTLNPNNNIADALRRFGVSASTETLVLVHIARAPPQGPDPVEVVSAMDALVDGELCTGGLALPGDAARTTPSDVGAATNTDTAEHSLAHLTLAEPALDWKALSKVYKLHDVYDYARATPHSVEPLISSTVATKFLG